MPKIEKTVFISYRRTNIYNALAVYQDLTSHDFDVFLDYERIDSGDFAQAIVENIKARAHFIIILTPSALERCDDPNDWLRKEIECALDNKRNIVPLMMEGFDYSSPSIEKHLVGKLTLLKNYNAQWVPAEFFQEAMTRVRNRFLNTTIGSVLHPLSTSADNEAKQQKVIADAQETVTAETLTAEEYFEQGFQHVENRNYDDAIMSYSEVIRLMPDLAEAYVNRSYAYLRKQDYKRVITDCTMAIRLNPDLVGAYNNLSLAYYGLGDFEQGILICNEVIRRQPKQVEAYINRAETNFSAGNFKEALTDFKKANQIRSALRFGIAGQAITHHALDDDDNAVKQWKMLCRLDNRFKDADWAGKELNWRPELIEEARKLIGKL